MTETPGVERQVVGALGSIGSATLASRVLGFVRDAVVALVFGAGPVTDAKSPGFHARAPSGPSGKSSRFWQDGSTSEDGEPGPRS